MTDRHAAGSTQAGALPALTRWQITVFAVLGVLSAALAGLAFLGMFTSVSHAMTPYFGPLAWVVPIGLDDGLLLVALFCVVLECFGMRCRWLRWVELVFVGLQLGVNVSAGDGSPIGSIGHASLPVLYVTVIEIWQWFVRKRRNLIQAKDRERIPLARWIAAPFETWELRRVMVLWGINRYSDALAMMQRVRIAESVLRRVYGSAWKLDTDGELLTMLHTPEFFAEAFERIRKMGAAEKKAAVRPPVRRDAENGDAAGGDAAGTEVKDCCGSHRALSTQTVIPYTFDAARALNNEHIAVHGAPIGAGSLMKLFAKGTYPARQLRDQLAESGSQSGSVGSGQSGQSGQSQPGQPVGVNGSNPGGGQ